MNWKVDPELGALARDASASDAPMHQLSSSLGDDEADAGALDQSRLLARSLERLEELVLLLDRDSETGVTNPTRTIEGVGDVIANVWSFARTLEAALPAFT